TRLRDQLVEDRRDARANRLRVEAIQRIARDDAEPLSRGFGVEAGRAVGAAENLRREVGVAQREHAAILVELSSPGDDLIERDHAGYSIMRATCDANHRCGARVGVWSHLVERELVERD